MTIGPWSKKESHIVERPDLAGLRWFKMELSLSVAIVAALWL